MWKLVEEKKFLLQILIISHQKGLESYDEAAEEQISAQRSLNEWEESMKKADSNL